MKVWCSLCWIITVVQLFSQHPFRQIDEYVETYAKTNDFSGCIYISKGNQPYFQQCYGMADFAFDVPNTIATKFKIGSISKQFTAAAILLLEEDGLLRTDYPLSRFYKVSPPYDSITIHQLLTHTSGIVDVYSVPNLSKLYVDDPPLGILVEMLFQQNLTFRPGTNYQYSNGGYIVLADIIEKVSGLPYGEFMKINVFDPLKMFDTGHYTHNAVIPGMALGYDPLGYKEVIYSQYVNDDLLKGAGSLYSTIADLETWINSINQRSLLSQKSYEKWLTNHVNGYGYGISLYRSDDNDVFGHDGRISGFIADYLYYKDSVVSVIILGNIQTGVADFLRRDLARIIFGKEVQSKAKSVGAIAVQLPHERFIGAYSFGPGFTVYIKENKNRLLARANEGAYSELVPLQNGQFFSRTLYSYIQFEQDVSGEISKMIWINNDGNRFEGLKK